jgi:tripartite-type tricarboxylate transporter receptor subunit TctC
MKLALAALLVLSFGGAAAAQKFPDRPVRIVVPNPAGGSNDAAARIVGQGLQDLIWPSGVVIENRAGGGGNVGAHAVATATPDGYTLLLTSPGPIVINPFLYKRLPFDPQKDFVPIALVARVPIVLMVNPNVQARSVGELIALIRRENGKLVYASSGVGSTHHLAAELFQKMANVTLQHVPYRGAAPAMNDLIAGHVPILFDNITTVIPQVKAGKVRALAVASAERVPWLPDVPTFAEAVRATRGTGRDAREDSGGRHKSPHHARRVPQTRGQRRHSRPYVRAGVRCGSSEGAGEVVRRDPELGRQRSGVIVSKPQLHRPFAR